MNLKRVLAAAVLLVALGLSEVAGASPIPHTPCAAIARGRVPSEHLRYWAVRGWNLTALGWTQHGGAGCWGDP